MPTMRVSIPASPPSFSMSLPSLRSMCVAGRPVPALPNGRGALAAPPAPPRHGHTVAAVVAVNACGSVIVGDGPHFWAAPFELDKEFGGFGFPAQLTPTALAPIAKGAMAENTTI